MSHLSNKPAPEAMNDAEPKSGFAPASVLLIGLFALLVYWGMVYLENHGGGFNGQVYQSYKNYADLDVHQPKGGPNIPALGKKVFAANCSPCHQLSGLGIPGQFPPVAGSEWVNAKSPNRIIRIVLNGWGGPIKVKDQTFNNAMVPWKDTLKDEDIAAVLTFVRQNKEWGNDAPAVTPEAVKAIREKTKAHGNPFSADELSKLPETE